MRKSNVKERPRTSRLLSSRYIWDIAAPAVLSFMLARIIMLTAAAPFGVSLFAAMARNERSAFVMLFCIIGYIYVWGDVFAYKYLAALGIIYICAVASRAKALPRELRALICALALFMPAFFFWAVGDMFKGTARSVVVISDTQSYLFE